MLKYLSKEFPKLSKAEEHFEVDYFAEDPLLNIASEPASSSPSATPKSGNRFSSRDLDSLSPLFFSPRGKSIGERSNMTVGDVIVEVCSLFRRMSLRLKRQLVTYLFRQLIRNTVSDVGFLKFVGRDFLDISVQAMQKLYHAGKNNLVYLLSKCFKAPEDQPDSVTATRLPLNKMPFGLLDYNIHFFAADTTVHLGTEPHYARWLETMYAHFGHKWLCLFRGPTWQYEEETRVSQKDKEVDVLEMALNISDISLFEANTVEAEMEVHAEAGVEDCTSVEKRKRTDEEKDDTVQSSNTVANVSTLWSRLGQEDVTEICEGVEDPKTVQEAAGVNPQASWQKQNSGIYNPLKVLLKCFHFCILTLKQVCVALAPLTCSCCG